MFLQIAFVAMIVSCALAKLDESLLSSDARELMFNYHKNCIDKTHADEEKIRKTGDGEFPEDDNNLKCYFKCTMVESGAMNEQNGDMSYEPVRHLYPDNLYDNLRNTFNTCKDQNDDQSDLCEKAFDMFKCFYRTNPENYFVF